MAPLGNATNTFFSSVRILVGWAAMLAILMAASVPLGFMPDKGHDGSVKVTICSGVGEKTILLDMTNGAASDAPYHAPTKNPICFALGTLAQGQIVVPMGFVLVSVPSLMALRLENMPRDSIIRDIHYAPYIARGPPQVTV